MKPFYITIEGLDFCGKTTLIEKLEKYLLGEGFSVKKIAMLGEGKIREAALHEPGLSSIARMMLMRIAADRAYAEIRQALSEGYVVLSDRGIDTYYAYQGHGDYLLNEIIRLDTFFSEPLYPDLTFYLDLSDEERKKRHIASGRTLDQIESKVSEYFTRVQLGFESIVKKDAENMIPRICSIDASASIGQVFTQAMLKIEWFLESREYEEEAQKQNEDKNPPVIDI